MHKIKTNSSTRIVLHQSQTINHKYTTRYSRNNLKEPKRETNYAKYCIHARGPVIWNKFLSETEKKTYLCRISLNVKSKKKYLNLKKNWASFKHRQRMKPHLKTMVLDEKALRLSARSYQQPILHLYIIVPYKRSYKTEVILNL